MKQTQEKQVSLEDAYQEINDKIKDLQRTLSELNTRARAIKIEIYIRDTGLDINTKVSIGFDTGIVTGFSTRYGDVRPIMTLYKLDGTLGKRQREIWSSDIKHLKILS